MNKRKRIVLLGATGSIGQSTCEVLRAHADKLELIGIASQTRFRELAEIAHEFKVPHIAIANEESCKAAKESTLFHDDVTFHSGQEGLIELATLEDADTIVVAVVGTAGLQPTLSAISHGKTIALASKEVLGKAGKFVMKAAQKHKVQILPMDSEHNALFQCIEGNDPKQLKRLILTASGGPFLDRPIQDLKNIQPEEALKHPNWDMGPKVTVDSSTMANKGLELIEARWLFNMPADKLDVVIHRQSIVHSFIEFIDGSILAQLCPPFMTFPIQHTLLYPERAHSVMPSLDFTQAMKLDFEPVDPERFICFKLALQSLEQGGIGPAVFNAANEVAVDAFLSGRLPYLGIQDVIERTLNDMDITEPDNLDAIIDADKRARELAEGSLTVS